MQSKGVRAFAFVASAVPLVFVEALFSPLTLVMAPLWYFKLIINTSSVFLCCCLYVCMGSSCYSLSNCFLRLQRVRTAVESPSFFAGSFTHLSRNRLCTLENSFVIVELEASVLQGRGSGDENSFSLALTWLCPSLIPTSSMHSFLRILNVTYHFRNILRHVLFACIGFSS